jgi:hypothetical protein
MTNANTEKVCFFHITWSGTTAEGEFIESDDCNDIYAFGHTADEALKGVVEELVEDYEFVGEVQVQVSQMTMGEVLQFKGTMLGGWMLPLVEADKKYRAVVH